MEIKEIVGQLASKMAEKGGIKQVYFAACGGSLGAFHPACTFLRSQSRTLVTASMNSSEFVHNIPRAFGENSVLVVASHKGNTPETVEAARIGLDMGASVIALTYFDGTPIHQCCDHVVRYSFGDERDISMEKPIQALKVAVEILHQTEGYPDYDKFYQGTAQIDGIVKRARAHVGKRAQEFARAHRDDAVIYTMGSGAGFGAAYMQSVCIFMEMQWIHSCAIHSGEFFHGPFEITDASVPFFIQVSEGKTRALDERALAFLRKYAARVEVLDAKELGLSTIDAAVVDYFNHSLFNNVYNVYNHALADIRQHPLTTRRYMWKVAY